MRTGTAIPPGAWPGLARSLVIYHGQPWRRRALRRLYRSLLPGAGLAFDVGAHVGSRTATLLGLGLRCVAIEPQPAFASWLARRYGRREDVVLVDAALGRAPGHATLHVSRRHPTVSTLSAGWIETMRASDGFEQVRWDGQVRVPVVTLDELIARHGLPDFCKIDVEGHEAEILEGLSTPLPLTAFEVLPAAMPLALACVARLEALGPCRYELTLGEAHRLQFGRWVDRATLEARLHEMARRGESGDVYARCEAARSSISGTSAPGRLPASDSSP